MRNVKIALVKEKKINVDYKGVGKYKVVKYLEHEF